MDSQILATKYRQLIKERLDKYNIQPDHDKTGHYYKLEDKRYPSVTKELQTLKDEGLMNWKMNRAIEYIQKNIGNLSLDELLENAKLAPVLEFENAGTIGSTVHNWREKWFQHWIDTDDATPPSYGGMEPAAISGCRGVIKFVNETSYIPLACELSLASHELEVGGMLDDIGLINNKLCLIDLKTSNIGNKTSYFLQVALYYYMFKKLSNIQLKEFYILHVSKENGGYNLITIRNIQQRIKDAKVLLKLNRSLEQIEEDKKKVPIII